MEQVGTRIREIRKNKKKTLAETAGAAGISVSFLSQIENSKATLTLVTMNKIAAALGVSVREFFGEKQDQEEYVRSAAGHPLLGFQKHYKQFYILSGKFEGRIMDCFRLVMEPHFEECENLTHSGEEFYYVVRGSLTVVIEGTVHEVKAGETIHFPSMRIHRVVNRGDEELEMICVVTPILY